MTAGLRRRNHIQSQQTFHMISRTINLIQSDLTIAKYEGQYHSPIKTSWAPSGFLSLY